VNADVFVDRIFQVVRESAISGTRTWLERPPGRAPQEKLVELSEWYNALDSTDRQRVMEVVTEAVDDAVFGFLCVLDGVRSIQDRIRSGERLELKVIGPGGESLLNDSAADEFLHDRYQAVVGRVV
jgi:hypothetical protein